MTNQPLDEERIFHTARLLPSDEAVADYLDQICAGDQALHDRVDALLAVHEKEQSFLESNVEPGPTVDESSVTVAPGQTIGRFKLLQKIGEGGFGVVYMAEQTKPVRRQVALKIIKPGMDTKDVVARFEAERQALAMMDHPNIARVFDGGETEAGHPYFVMELVRGEPINRFCDKNRLDTRKRLEMFKVVCDAIQHAHQKGVIHRDIKPSNVLVTLHDGNPVPKVIDFGVAKAISQQLTAKTLFTAYGQMVGTPQYMSPEQAEMSGLGIDTRSDIYSLGVLVYELLTGSTPIEPSRLRQTAYAEVLRMICEEEPPKPSRRLSSLGEQSTKIAASRQSDANSLCAALRGELDWIVMKALDKDRDRRYDTAKGFALDVQRYLSDDPVSACPPSSAYLIRKAFRRHRGPVLISIGFIGLLVAAVIGTGSGWYQERIQKEKTDEALVAAVHAKTEATRERERVQDLANSRGITLYAADMNNAMTAWEKNDLRHLKQLLDKYAESSLRGWEWYHLSNLYEEASPNPILANIGNLLRVYNSPRSERIVLTHSRGPVLSLLEPDGVAPVTFGDLEDGTFAFTYATFSRDGSLLAHPSDDLSSLIVRSMDSMRIVNEIPVPQEFAESNVGISTATFSPDGRVLAVAIRDRGVAIYDLQAQQFDGLLPVSGLGKCEVISYSSDGQFLAVSSEPTTVWNAKDRTLICELPGHTQEVTTLQFVNEDAWLVSGSRDRSLIVWDYESKERVRTLGPFDGEVRCIAYDAESERLAAGLRNRKLKTWTLPDFGELEELRGYNGLYAVSFTPSGRMVYGAFGGGIAVRDKEESSSPRRLACGGYGVDTEFSSDGRHLICLVSPNEESNPEWGKLELRSLRIDGQGASSMVIPPIPFGISCIATTRSGNSNLLVVGAHGSSRVQVIDLSQEFCKVIYDSQAVDSQAVDSIGVSAVCFSDDEESVYCGLENGKILELDFGGSNHDRMYSEDHSARVTAIAPLGNGGCVSGAGDGSLMIWKGGRLESDDLGVDSRGTWIRGLDTHRDSIVFGLFGLSAEGHRIFHIDSNRQRRGLYGHTFSMVDMKLIEDGKTLVSLGGDREIKLWNTDTFEQRLAIRESEIFNSLAVSPDESIIAAGTREGSVFLYRAPRND